MHMTPVECAVQAFGGKSKLAKAIGVQVYVVCHWTNERPWQKRKRQIVGNFPDATTMRLVLEAAAERGLELSAEDLIRGREVVAVS